MRNVLDRKTDRRTSVEFAPHSNGLLKANTRELEFIAGTKLIENKIGCRRVRVPNVDDVAARRILGVMGVAPQVLQVPSGLQKRACHCPVCDTYRRLQRAGFAPTHPTAQCSFRKATGIPSAGRGRERPGRPGRGSRLLVVEYWRSCVSEDEFYF